MVHYLQWVLYALTAVLVLFTVMPLVRWRMGAIRGPEFFRLQLFWIAIVVAVVAAFVPQGRYIALVGSMVAVVQLACIIKFTSLWWRQSLDAGPDLRADSSRHISILAANVKKSNRDFAALVDLTLDHLPDVVLAIEVDEDWIDALEAGLGAEYAHWVRVPMDTGYGICVMSRLALSDVGVREIVTEGVPSVRASVELRSGAKVRLYVVHPEPPVFGHDTMGRDSEIAHIGLEAAQDSLPSIVTGDLNDVAWSGTTRSFQRLSGLLDPRVGRGFYNTFNAFHWWARWPLDHLFHDPQFRVLDVSRMHKIGSDHFPMLFSLALSDEPAQQVETLAADADEKAEAREMIAQEKVRPRAPIGTDWED